MSKFLRKSAVSLAILTLMLAPVFMFAMVASAEVDVGLEYAEDTGLGNEDPRTIAAGVINVIMGFLGIVAVVIILLGGFKWMTAGGNEDKTGEAKNLITAGVIGLVIILAAFGIATFVLESILNVTGSGG